jgi:SAM-dependent methyltransferase
VNADGESRGSASHVPCDARGGAEAARRRSRREREEWDRRYDTADYVWHADPNRFLPELVGDLAPGRALDLACGEGRNAVWLARQGWSVTAVDFSAVGIAKGERLASEQGVTVDWVVGDVTEWTPAAGGFDLVIVFYVQLPAAARAAMLDRAAHALASRGTFVMLAHDRTNLTEGIGGPQDEQVLPTAELIVADLEASGVHVDVARAERIRRPVETPAGPRDAIDCLVVASRPD